MPHVSFYCSLKLQYGHNKQAFSNAETIGKISVVLFSCVSVIFSATPRPLANGSRTVQLLANVGQWCDNVGHERD